MPLETHRRKIGDHEYLVSDLARRQYVRLLSIVTKALAGSDLLRGKGDLSAIVAAAANLGPDEIEKVSEILGEASKVIGADGKGHTLTPQHQDLHFSGRYAEYFQWLAFGIEVNLRPLLTGLFSAVGGSEPAMASE